MPLTKAMATALELHGVPEPLPQSKVDRLTPEALAERRLAFVRRSTISDGTPAQKVLAFRQLYKLPVPSDFTPLSHAEKILHRNLINEEAEEFSDAVNNDDPTEMIDALLDLIYVAYGAMLNMGLSPAQIDRGFEEVHASNMTKTDSSGKPIFSDVGKVLKGPHYVPPAINEVLFLT